MKMMKKKKSKNKNTKKKKRGQEGGKRKKKMKSRREVVSKAKTNLALGDLDLRLLQLLHDEEVATKKEGSRPTQDWLAVR